MNVNDDMSFILPIIKYHLKEFFNNFDITINYKINDNFVGYKNYYVMDAFINEEEDKLLFNINESDNKYLVNVRCMSRKIPNSILSISIDTDKINIKNKILFNNVVEETTYELIDNPSVERKLYKNDKLITYNKDDLSCNMNISKVLKNIKR